MLRPEHARYQPNGWACGPTALYHAIRCYGESAVVREIERIASPHDCACEYDGPRGGYCEHQLGRAALDAGFRLEHWLTDKPRHLYKELRTFLYDRVPVLLSINHNAHWVTAVRADARGIWICDSSRDQVDILQRRPWRWAQDALVYKLPPEFHMYPLVLP